MLFIIVMIVSIATVMCLGMMSHVDSYKKMKETEYVKQSQLEKHVAEAKLRSPETFKDIEIKSTISEKALKTIAVKEITITPKTPQINNYNFESIGKGLLAIGSVLSIIFGLNYTVKLFNYLSTIRRFSKHEKRTNKLLNKLKICFDDRKEFLLLADSIEHQLKLNDLLLTTPDAKKYGIQLEVADDYLYEEYHFINNNLLNQLK